MKIRNIIAAATAAIVGTAALAVSAFALDNPANSVIIGFGDADWKASFWAKDGDAQDFNTYCPPVAITGNGTYTVVLDLSTGYTNPDHIDEETGEEVVYTTGNGIGAMGLVFNSEDEAVGMDIKSVKIDGVEMTLTGSSYTNNEDGGRRTNIYNAWAAFKPENGDISLDPDNATATVIDITDLTEWSKVEVTFDVYGMADTVVDTGADTGATGADKGSPDTGVEGVAVVAGLAVVAAGALAISKKRR